MSDLFFSNIAIEDEHSFSYALLIAALGYESRATAVSKRLKNQSLKQLAIGFDHNRIIAYADNLAWYISNGFRIAEGATDTEFLDVAKSAVDTIPKSHGAPVRIAVDVSCLNRFRIASVISLVLPEVIRGNVAVDFWYALAEFQLPKSGWTRNEFAGPIHRNFAGWFSDPGRPIALLAGLGYEEGKVMGATEYLQASRVVAFFPTSPIADYEEHVRAANERLLDEIDTTNLIRYPVHDTVATIAMLESSIRGLKETHNVVVLPLGPKIFTVCSLLAQRFHRDSSVWRVSAGSSLEPRDVVASPHLFGVSLKAGHDLSQSQLNAPPV